jgi:hypothetical protein
MRGAIPPEIIDALLDTIPVELTILDEHDRIIGWNSGRPRLFERTPEIMGSDVRACHSTKSLGLLERMLSEMKEGTRSSARFWYDEEREGARRKILVDYFALRDQTGRYLGCIEALQEISDLRSLEGEKRTLD